MFNLVKSESKRFAPTSYYNILLVRLSFLITLHDPNSVSMDNIVIRCTLIRNVRMAQLGWSASASFMSPMYQGLVSMGGELSPNNTYDIILLLLVTICNVLIVLMIFLIEPSNSIPLRCPVPIKRLPRVTIKSNRTGAQETRTLAGAGSRGHDRWHKYEIISIFKPPATLLSFSARFVE